MRRNVLPTLVGVLLILTAILAWQLYEERKKSRLEVRIGEDGVSVEAK